MIEIDNKYAFVNERVFNGRNYKAYRSMLDPKDCIVVIDDETIIETKTLKNYWLICGADNN